MSLHAMLLTLRLVSSTASFLALLMYIIGNTTLNHYTAFGYAFLAALLQMFVCACLGTTPRFLNDLSMQVLMMIIDFMAAFFAMGTGWAIFGIVVTEMVDQRCPQDKCTMSIMYGLLIWLAGATGGVAACCHMAVVAKLRRQQHA